jgi:predicted RNase H-like nuclease (RuvC/YqgF family)
MNNHTDDIISRLRNNFRRIIHQYELKKEEIRTLKLRIDELERQLSSITHENEELKNKYENTSIAKAFSDASGSNHDAKIKVNRIVREIDKCIALLNN